ncbi:MAG: ERF family protein [Phascolarctobacterium sp.]|nr:ERF family protein [Phascolarctobacterium sp.]
MLENKNIAKKLVKVMSECSHIIKNGQNDYHNYKYATAEDVLQKVNASLTKYNIASIVSPSLESMIDVLNRNGNKEHLATVSVQVHLIDGDTGESVDLFGIGSGQDAGDKAVMKAQTAAIKYAFMLSLCIATGDDPEADNSTDENMGAEKQQKQPTQVKDNKNHVCSCCNSPIGSEKVIQFSIKKYGRPLCMDCQKTESKVA